MPVSSKVPITRFCIPIGIGHHTHASSQVFKLWDVRVGWLGCMKRCIKQVKLVGSQFYSGSLQLRVTGDRHESRRKDEVLPRQLSGSKQINEWSLRYYESDSVYSRQVSMNGYISYIVLAEYQLTKLKIWFINHLVLMKPMRQ